MCSNVVFEFFGNWSYSSCHGLLEFFIEEISWNCCAMYVTDFMASYSSKSDLNVEHFCISQCYVIHCLLPPPPFSNRLLLFCFCLILSCWSDFFCCMACVFEGFFLAVAAIVVDVAVWDNLLANAKGGNKPPENKEWQHIRSDLSTTLLGLLHVKNEGTNPADIISEENRLLSDNTCETLSPPQYNLPAQIPLAEKSLLHRRMHPILSISYIASDC